MLIKGRPVDLEARPCHPSSCDVKGGGRQMPFQDHADAFAPGDLEVMTAAFNTVTKSSPRLLTSNEKTALAQRIMESAANGVVDIGPLTRVALGQLAHFEPTLRVGAESDARRFHLAFWARA